MSAFQTWAGHRIKPDVAILTVGGFWDQEDLFGPQEAYRVLEPNDARAINHIVLGPWYHGQWSRPGGEAIASLQHAAGAVDLVISDVVMPVMGGRELGERLGHLRAGRAWIAIAACYGAGFTEVLAPGRILTGASAADALAYESSQYGRSYMVQYMVREAMIERRAPDSVRRSSWSWISMFSRVRRW